MKLSYYNSNYNFGDVLNITILENIFNIKNVVYEPKIIKADMIAIGSIFESLIKTKHEILTIKKYIKNRYKLYSLPKIEVFGTGFIEEPSQNVEFIRRINLIAVRGKFTKSNVDRITKRKNEITLGDPGLLSKELYDLSKVKKRYKLGMVPHYVDKKNKYISEINKMNSKSKIIDIQQEPFAFLKQISQCEVIISSAMHGLIAADSLNIPNLRLTVSNKLTGGNYKFHDYYSVFNMQRHTNLNFFNDSYSIHDLPNLLDTVYEKYINKEKEIDHINKNLLLAFKTKSNYA